MKKQRILILIAVLLPMGVVIAWAVNRLFFTNEDADEGDHKFWQFFKKKPKVATTHTNTNTMNYKIINITDTLTKHRTKRYPTRKLDVITQAVIHHSATLSRAIGSKPQVYAKYHVEQRGWAGIGYHFVIQPDGAIYQVNTLATTSNHVQNANTKSIGICLSGNFDTETPTPEAYGAAIWLVKSLNSQLGRKLDIKAHNEYAPKSCPGAAIDIVKFRESVNLD